MSDKNQIENARFKRIVEIIFKETLGIIYGLFSYKSVGSRYRYNYREKKEEIWYK